MNLLDLLALCSGHNGIAEGQELDLKFEKKKKINQIIDMQKKRKVKI